MKQTVKENPLEAINRTEKTNMARLFYSRAVIKGWNVHSHIGTIILIIRNPSYGLKHERVRKVCAFSLITAKPMLSL